MVLVSYCQFLVGLSPLLRYTVVTRAHNDIIVISAATTMMSSCTLDGPVIDIR